MSNIIDSSLEARQRKIQVAKSCLRETKELFDAFGSAELKTSQARFAELQSALESDAVRLVVLGEFSRGKSSLINALLDIELLPTALQATTAINTFVRSLPAGRSDRFIRIHFQDGRPAQEVAWKDDAALERWGTELDESHADVRKTIDYIEAFMDHPLLAKGLVLVDTPGMQAVMAHHEHITRKAVAEAHIALWVQNATMLGGSATEWDFLSETIRTSFRKFVTVIGWWDLVLEPTDAPEKRKPVEVRTWEKLEVVKQNFRKYLGSDEEAELLTNAEHLIPVSARWAMSGDPVKKSQSGIDVLAARISEMFSSGEALEQIYSKPLQQLSHIQQQLSASLADELRQLESDKTLAERAREIDMLNQDIHALKLESDGVYRDSKEEHERVARTMVEKIQRDLVQPLAELKAEIEQQVNERYVQRMIDTRCKTIGLPQALHEHFQQVSAQVGRSWKAQTKELTKVLEALRADYAKQMEKHAGQLKGELSKLDIDIPSLDIGFKLDFSELEQYHNQVMDLEREIAARNDEIESIAADMSKYSSTKPQIDMARQAVERAQRMLEQMGSPPSPTTKYRKEVIKKGGTYSSDQYGQVPYTDDSNLKDWEAERDRQWKNLADKEARMAQLMAEEERRTGLRMTQGMAQKKYEREVADFQKKMDRLKQKAEAAHGDMIHETTQHLIKNTAGQLNQRIRYLQDHVAEGIHQVFMDQLKALQGCVQEQYLEPMNAKLAKREEIQALMQQSATDIERRKTNLTQAQQALAELLARTQDALQA